MSQCLLINVQRLSASFNHCFWSILTMIKQTARVTVLSGKFSPAGIIKELCDFARSFSQKPFISKEFYILVNWPHDITNHVTVKFTICSRRGNIKMYVLLSFESRKFNIYWLLINHYEIFVFQRKYIIQDI